MFTNGNAVSKRQELALVTGGLGFIGCHVVRQLVASFETVRILDNETTGTVEDLAVALGGSIPDSVEIHQGNITDARAVSSAVEGSSVVVHLAASTGVIDSLNKPYHDLEINLVGTHLLLHHSLHAGVTKFVFASSGSVVGDVPNPIHEASVPQPSSPYGASKLAGESYCSAYFRSFGLSTCSLRFSNVYGPGSHRKNSAVAKFTKAALSGTPITVFGDGNQSRDFLHVSDLVRAVELAISASEAGGEVFQIASGWSTSVNTLLSLLGATWAELGIPAPPIIHASARAGEVRKSSFSISKAREVLGWNPQASLSTNLQETVDSLKARLSST